jgi:hypothetical protein
MMFGSTQSESGDTKWRRQLDKFVKANKLELAALSWALWLENSDTQGTIGIDLQPQPHFVYCPKEQVEKLNDRVENRLQELLGIIDHYQPEIEVVMIGIGSGEVKLIQFAPSPAPPNCFEQIGNDVDTLLQLLEQRMREEFSG